MLENVPTETDTSTSSSTAQTLPTRARGEIELRDVLVRYQPHGNTGHSNGSSSGNSIDSNAAPQAADAHAASDDEQAHTPPALQHINLHIAPGEVVAFVGQSGAGKTTLVNLLPRFVLPTSGQILLDGTSISDWPLAQLRAQIAMVSQDVVMLNQSIAANVALGRDIDRAQVQAALEAANLAGHIAKLPQGIDTVVGHNATQLSGGQRQRLAIARAIYKDAPILLLDEATSALDNESERLVQEALQRLMQGRTTLIVAHRLSTIEHADRVVVMEGGRIVEQGSHAELLQRGGVYARLHQR
jgi:subfamily B ATP-binding cassette protein MsbA